MKDTNDYGSFADIPRNQTLVVVEGDFEKKTVLNLLCNCFPKLNIQKEEGIPFIRNPSSFICTCFILSL